MSMTAAELAELNSRKGRTLVDFRGPSQRDALTNAERTAVLNLPHPPTRPNTVVPGELSRTAKFENRQASGSSSSSSPSSGLATFRARYAGRDGQWAESPDITNAILWRELRGRQFVWSTMGKVLFVAQVEGTLAAIKQLNTYSGANLPFIEHVSTPMERKEHEARFAADQAQRAKPQVEALAREIGLPLDLVVAFAFDVGLMAGAC